jgi:hypothetical protein
MYSTFITLQENCACANPQDKGRDKVEMNPP